MPLSLDKIAHRADDLVNMLAVSATNNSGIVMIMSSSHPLAEVSSVAQAFMAATAGSSLRPSGRGLAAPQRSPSGARALWQSFHASQGLVACALLRLTLTDTKSKPNRALGQLNMAEMQRQAWVHSMTFAEPIFVLDNKCEPSFLRAEA
eukprot:6208365-Pleurochrysis_carterae.AAC.2